MSKGMRKLKRAVIKEELYALTGSMEKAVILNQFIYWSERIKDYDKFIEEEKKRALSGPHKAEHVEYIDEFMQNGWIYKSMAELKDEIMFDGSETTMSRRIDELLEGGWLERRSNPKYAWDRVYQYRVNLINIAKDLYELGYFLEGYRYDIAELLQSLNPHSGASDFQIEESIIQIEESNSQTGEAIPEITTEITSDINHSFNQDEKNERMNTPTNIYNEVLKNIEINGLYKEYRKPIDGAIRLLCYTKEFNHNNMSIPQEQMLQDVLELNRGNIDHAINAYKNKSKNERMSNPINYLAATIYNSIFDMNIRTESDLRYYGYVD